MGIELGFLLKHVRPYGFTAFSNMCNPDGELDKLLKKLGVTDEQIQKAFSFWGSTAIMAVNQQTEKQFVEAAKIISEARWDELYKTSKSTIMFMDDSQLQQLSEVSEINPDKTFHFIPSDPIIIAVTIDKHGGYSVDLGVEGCEITTDKQGLCVHFNKLV